MSLFLKDSIIYSFYSVRAQMEGGEVVLVYQTTKTNNIYIEQI
jgi:hypothetical protein